mmetsp:Transcript_137929/g.428632  ORF Transcript_137929/g.428632 Transcript_137929/m.428632 type:complete len:202 (+) Transcript_137929:318-923(+)
MVQASSQMLPVCTTAKPCISNHEAQGFCLSSSVRTVARANGRPSRPSRRTLAKKTHGACRCFGSSQFSAVKMSPLRMWMVRASSASASSGRSTHLASLGLRWRRIKARASVSSWGSLGNSLSMPCHRSILPQPHSPRLRERPKPSRAMIQGGLSTSWIGPRSIGKTTIQPPSRFAETKAFVNCLILLPVRPFHLKTKKAWR